MLTSEPYRLADVNSLGKPPGAVVVALDVGMASRKGPPILSCGGRSRRGDGHRDGAEVGADPVVKLTAPAALRPGGGR